jgi:hypothetical protein
MTPWLGILLPPFSDGHGAPPPPRGGGGRGKPEVGEAW